MQARTSQPKSITEPGLVAQISAFVQSQEPLCVLEKLCKADSIRLYLTGGVLRDISSGQSVSDIDLRVLCSPEEKEKLKAALEQEIQTKKLRGLGLDLSATEDVFQEVSCYDFHANMLCYEVSSEQLYDVSGRALEDIRSRSLQIANPSLFPLRPAQFVRCASLEQKTNFSLSASSLEYMSEHAPLLAAASLCEQKWIVSELCKLLCLSQPLAALERLQELGILRVVLPELAPSLRSAQEEELFLRLRNFEKALDSAKNKGYLLRIARLPFRNSPNTGPERGEIQWSKAAAIRFALLFYSVVSDTLLLEQEAGSFKEDEPRLLAARNRVIENIALRLNKDEAFSRCLYDVQQLLAAQVSSGLQAVMTAATVKNSDSSAVALQEAIEGVSSNG